MATPYQVFCFKIKPFVTEKLKTDINFRHIDFTKYNVGVIDDNLFINGEPTFHQVLQKSCELWLFYDDSSRAAVIKS